MLFQEPGAALDPVRTVGDQIGEAIRLHARVSAAEARRRAVDRLREVSLPDPESAVDEYPHRLSGGQKQRVGLAIALAADPALLIADEPTTALDATVAGEVLELLARLRRSRGLTLLLISHDLGLVARESDRVLVLYAGRIVEEGATSEIFRSPRHPYTRGLARQPAAPRGRERFAPPVPGHPRHRSRISSSASRRAAPSRRAARSVSRRATAPGRRSSRTAASACAAFSTKVRARARTAIGGPHERRAGSLRGEGPRQGLSRAPRPLRRDHGAHSRRRRRVARDRARRDARARRRVRQREEHDRPAAAPPRGTDERRDAVRRRGLERAVGAAPSGEAARHPDGLSGSAELAAPAPARGRSDRGAAPRPADGAGPCARRARRRAPDGGRPLSVRGATGILRSSPAGSASASRSRARSRRDRSCSSATSPCRRWTSPWRRRS